MNGPDRLTHANVRMILEGYLERHNGNSFPWVTDPELVEVGVAAPLFEAEKDFCICGHKGYDHKEVDDACSKCSCPSYKQRIIHIGKMDLLGTQRADMKSLCPVDHKTTGKLDARFVQQFSLDSQMTGYLFDAMHYSKQDINTCFINAIELSLVPTSTRKCPLHGVPYEECGPTEHLKFQVIGPIERTRKQIDQWKETAIFLAKRFNRLRGLLLSDTRYVSQEGTFNNGCGYCEFREFCLADRNPKQASAMFEQAEWSPFKHVFGENSREQPDPLALYIDNSTLKSVASCSTQALMRYGLHWTTVEQTGPLLAGTAVHAGLECWFKGGTEKAALAAFDKVYTDAVTE